MYTHSREIERNVELLISFSCMVYRGSAEYNKLLSCSVLGSALGFGPIYRQLMKASLKSFSNSSRMHAHVCVQRVCTLLVYNIFLVVKFRTLPAPKILHNPLNCFNTVHNPLNYFNTTTWKLSIERQQLSGYIDKTYKYYRGSRQVNKLSII